LTISRLIGQCSEINAYLVTARNTVEQTALHIAAENNLPSFCNILLGHKVDFAAVDNRGNNALHVV
jgi:ankyrin repeat protein